MPGDAFTPGLELNAAFYSEVVGPLVAAWPHAAARLGTGSEVLGFDSSRSTDHGWGPNLTLFVEEDAVDAAAGAVDAGLPEEFRGWPVRYGWDDRPVEHHVRVTTLPAWFVDQIGFDPTGAVGTTDWLLAPQQKLLEVTSGAVYRDDTGDLERARQRLSGHPDQVWLWMLACQWRRIAQEEAFVGRTSEAGDELGSRVIAARLARELMRLWFLLHRVYWPYTKWFGTAFSRLPGAEHLGAALDAALAADSFEPREEALLLAYTTAGETHNALAVTEPVDPRPRPFYGRPYRVMMADRFADACSARVVDPDLARLPLVGSVDQVADSTDLLAYTERVLRLRALYS